MTQDIIGFCTPEEAGVPSGNIETFIRRLESMGAATHSLILARGNRVFFEHYWPPFHREFLHRMYSVTKSFVSLAIGFLEQDGKIGLDDPICKYFPEELKHQPDQNLHNQTIRHMLMMSTAKIAPNWFVDKTDDRAGSILKIPPPCPGPPVRSGSMTPPDPSFWAHWWSG